MPFIIIAKVFKGNNRISPIIALNLQNSHECYTRHSKLARNRLKQYLLSKTHSFINSIICLIYQEKIALPSYHATDNTLYALFRNFKLGKM
jgi:uncharacterized CHY-type Zn-finger protein